MANGLDKLVDDLSHGRFGILLVSGYPNIDLVAPAEADTIAKNNPNKNIEDYISIDRGSIQLHGRGIELKNSKTVYLAEPALMTGPDGNLEQRLFAGTKYTSPNKFTVAEPKDYITLGVKRVELGGGMSKSLQAIYDMLGKIKGYKKKLFSLTSLGKSEEELTRGLSRLSHAVTIDSDISPRVNWVIPYAKLENGETAFNDRIIAKHPSKEIFIPFDRYEGRIQEELAKDYASTESVNTILLNGVKSWSDIRNALDYSLKHGTHLVAVVTDSTARLGEVVNHDLLHHATYISNNDELGIFIGENTSKLDDGRYVINLEDTLQGIRKIREHQRKDSSYQNIYVTLGEYGSLSVDKEGNIHWIGSYSTAWSNTPDATGFGDTFAAGIALAENVDRNINTVYAQMFASALVASKMRNPNYRVESPSSIRQLIRDNPLPTIYLGQFDEHNHLGNLRQKRITRLDTWLRTSPLIYKKSQSI